MTRLTVTRVAASTKVTAMISIINLALIDEKNVLDFFILPVLSSKVFLYINNFKCKM